MKHKGPKQVQVKRSEMVLVLVNGRKRVMMTRGQANTYNQK